MVERDNRRISIRSIPDYRVLATFGDDVLRKPYGLWVQEPGDNRFRLFVTDACEMPDESVPPNDELDARVKQRQLTVARDSNGAPVGIDSRFEKSFGDTTNAGALRIVESIFGDPLHDRLLIAEEDESPVACGLRRAGYPASRAAHFLPCTTTRRFRLLTGWTSPGLSS